MRSPIFKVVKASSTTSERFASSSGRQTTARSNATTSPPLSPTSHSSSSVASAISPANRLRLRSEPPVSSSQYGRLEGSPPTVCGQPRSWPTSFTDVDLERKRHRLPPSATDVCLEGDEVAPDADDGDAGHFRERTSRLDPRPTYQRCARVPRPGEHPASRRNSVNSSRNGTPRCVGHSSPELRGAIPPEGLTPDG
jgi:hypothetical protein